MRLVHASYSSSKGGASRAASRIHEATSRHVLDSWFIESEVSGSIRNSLQKQLEGRISKWQGSEPGNFRSSAIIPGKNRSRIEELRPDIINLHWIGKGFLSIEQIARIRAPMVWTLHDMWPFSGTQHYSDGSLENWWDALTYRRKQVLWRNPISFIAPNSWIAKLATQGPIFRDSSVRVIPNPVPIENFYPEDKGSARAHFPLGGNDLVVGFVSDMGSANPLKGSAYLIEAMKEVRLNFPGAILLIVGRGRKGENLPPWIIETGLLTSDEMLRSAYAACDVIAVPSVADNSPQSISEAAACERPVVAFNIGGISELVDDGVSGLLVPPLDTVSLARGLSKILSDETTRKVFGANGRAKCLREWDPHVIGRKYTDAYDNILSASEGRK